MKRFAVLMALVALTFTGCTQGSVFGPMARKGGENLRTAMTKKSRPTKNIRKELDSTSDIQLTAFGKQSNCCDCTDECCGGDACCSEGCCCDGSCGDSCNCGNGCNCSDGSCGNGRCGNGLFGNGRCGNGCGLGGRMAGCNPHAGGYPEAQNFNPGPPSGQVAYPYYTVRGPRDFLRDNPPSIGPY